jgi:hypothetical protein
MKKSVESVAAKEILFIQGLPKSCATEERWGGPLVGQTDNTERKGMGGKEERKGKRKGDDKKGKEG